MSVMSGVNVIIPLGGLGSRFQKEGYLTRPKPFVPVLGKPMILWVIENLTIGMDDTLVIVYNPSFMNLGHFMREIVGSSYPDCKFVELPGPTRGAAETVLLGLRALDEEQRSRPTLLADGDTFYTVDIVTRFRAVAGTHNAVFCFNDTQPKPIYSYIKLDASDDVQEIKEKVKISDWANSGCYCFRNGKHLAQECEALIEANTQQMSQDGIGEFYTSGVIAAMVSKKEPFRALKIEPGDMHVLGTPSQVEEFCKTYPTQPKHRFVFDLEGALVVEQHGEPIARNIDACKRLKAQGHTIIVQSKRAWGTEKRAWAYLEELGVPCDELLLGKPRGDFYICGPSALDSTLACLDKQTGFFPTDVKASAVCKSAASSRPPKMKKPTLQKIGCLHPGSSGFTCVVRVLDDLRESATQPSAAKFWEVTCGDETGKVVLSLREDQRSEILKGKLLTVRNGYAKIVKGFLRLVVDKWGKLDLDVPEKSIDADAIGDQNLSLIEYELAAPI